MQRENRGSRGNARPSGESRETERRRELSSEYDRYRAAYARRAEREEAPDLTRREERGASSREHSRRSAQRPAEQHTSREQRAAGNRSGRSGAVAERTAHPAGRRTPEERPEHSAAQRRSAAPKDRRSRREQVMRAARLRMAGLAAALLLAVGGSIYGIAHLISPADADTDRGSSSMAEGDSTNIADGGTAAPDITTSATVKALSGARLETVVAQRLAASADNVVTDPGESAGGTTTQTPTSSWGTFDPATVGSSGKGNIASWKAKNSDVVGWLRIPNTNINYPVVVGPDNLYYSAKGYDKNYSYYGVIWADSDTKFGNRNQISQNTVLYGHNWTNVSANPFVTRASDIMFGQLPSFHHLNFCKSTPYIHYSTESEEMTWKVFAAFYTEESFNYITSDPGASGLQYIINEAKARSLHDFAVDVNSSDKILTLSTCTRAYGKTNKQRFVVMARLMRPGETITEVNITPNPDFKRPQL